MNLQTPNSQAEVPYAGIGDTLRHVRGELNLYTYDQRRVGDDRVQWPAGGRFVIYMTNLPDDCHELVSSIIEMLEATESGFIGFPVLSVEIRHDDDLIVIIGDEERISLMRPMPT